MKNMYFVHEFRHFVHTFTQKYRQILSEAYIPPFTMTDEITNLVIEIAVLTGAMTVSEQLSKNPKHRGAKTITE